MPLIVLTGIPSSGKSQLADELKTFFETEHGKVVQVVSENTAVQAGQANTVYMDPGKEKSLRGTLKSEVVRLLHKDKVLILDGLNYIKGFRYELYCATKAAKTTQCTVHCDVSPEDAWSWNLERNDSENKYDKDVFEALRMRYEAPVAHNRWDAPLLLHLKVIPEKKSLTKNTKSLLVCENKPHQQNFLNYSLVSFTSIGSALEPLTCLRCLVPAQSSPTESVDPEQAALGDQFPPRFG